MARSFDPYDLSAMSDDEIYDVVVQHLGEYPELDMGWIDVSVRGGKVTLAGRVASDGEAQIAEKALVEVVGVTDVVNELIVDELHRGEAPMAADDARAQDEDVDDQMGEPTHQNQSDTAAHLMEDVETQTYGTHDVGTAIEEGASYTPPQRPLPDGYTSREDH
jgi:hypothetical protein